MKWQKFDSNGIMSDAGSVTVSKTQYKVGVSLKNLIIGSVVVAFALVSGCSAVSYRNDFISAENGLTAQYEKNQNTYSSYFNTVKEMAQVPEMYAKDLKDVYTAAIQGRYGADGSKQVMLFVKEHNPTLDPAMYLRIQTAIASGRAKFESEQNALLDKKRVYLDSTQRAPGSVFAWAMGFPRLDMNKIGIVIDDNTAKAFDTKRAEPIKLR
jgi:outer membrane murein-binding lipoprotein Lpp